jgi:hypothetical protein
VVTPVPGRFGGDGGLRGAGAVFEGVDEQVAAAPGVGHVVEAVAVQGLAFERRGGVGQGGGADLAQAQAELGGPSVEVGAFGEDAGASRGDPVARSQWRSNAG